MYPRALPLQWPYNMPQPVVDISPRSDTPLYFTGCSVVPISPNQLQCRVSNSRKALLPLPTFNVPSQNTSHVLKLKQPAPLLMKLLPKEPCGTSTNSSLNGVMAVPHISVETLLGVNLECIIKLVKSSTEKPATETSNSNLNSESISRGLKRHLNPPASPSPSAENSDDNPVSKRLKSDDQEKHEEIEKTEKDLPMPGKISQDSSHSSTSLHSVDKSIENTWEKVSKVMWEIYMAHRQSEDMYMKKTRLREALHNLLKKSFPYCGLYMVGSSLNSLGSNFSDLDMCMMLSHCEIDQGKEATNILYTILRIIRECEFVKYPMVIPAKVPILKFFDTISGVEVDLNINNAVGIRNTQLMYCYARMDWRVKPLVLLVKMWAKEQNINDAKNMTLSSYSLVLMVIHFLQFGATPCVIPCLQKLMQNKFHPQSDIRQLVLNEDLPPFKSSNSASLGELMFQLLEYYGKKFQFRENVISVRTGGVLPKHEAMNFLSTKNKRGHWKFISIEEPFDRTNTARSVFNEGEFLRILDVFATSFNRLNETKDLSSIINVNHYLS